MATTESPLSVTMGGGEALIWPSAVLGGEGVPELDGQDSSNSSGELGPVARALEASGSLDPASQGAPISSLSEALCPRRGGCKDPALETLWASGT